MTRHGAKTKPPSHQLKSSATVLSIRHLYSLPASFSVNWVKYKASDERGNKSETCETLTSRNSLVKSNQLE